MILSMKRTKFKTNKITTKGLLEIIILKHNVLWHINSFYKHLFYLKIKVISLERIKIDFTDEKDDNEN